ALLAAAALFCVAAFFRDLWNPPTLYPCPPGIVLVESFLVGVTIFCFRRSIRVKPMLFALALAATIALLIVPPGQSVPYGDYLIAWPASYVTVYLGLLNPARNKILLSGDYSYGIFLYGFPIQQAVAAVAPHSPIAIILVALPLTVALAAGSWWLVENQALRLRSWLPSLE